MRCGVLLVVFLFQATAAAAQSPAVDDLLRRVEAPGLEAAKQRTPTVPVPTTVPVPAGADLQAAINAAPDGAVLALEPGATYAGVVIKHPVTITTRGWSADRLVTPRDAPAMATIQGRAGYGAWILSNKVTLIGVQLLNNLPSGAGELVRVGDASDPDIAHVPADITLRQLLLRGSDSATFGQKRAISANGKHVLVDQVWCDRIWITGQDSQCVAAWSTPGPVTVRRSALSAASENVLIGGSPPASPAHFPEDILIEDNALWKPLAWKTATVGHQIKNLVEVKFGRRVVIRRNWLQHNWPQAQAGSSVLLTLAINGQCPFCELADVTFEDNVIWGVSSGLNILGHNYTAAYGPAGQAHGIIVRNNLWYIDSATMGGDGRAILMGSEPKDITVTRNTFIYSGNSFLNVYYGGKIPPGATAPVPGGPVTGFIFSDNLARHSNYGVFTPDGSSGAGLAVFFPGGIFSGNVIGGASTAAQARYNAVSGGRPNLYPDMATYDAGFRDRAGLDLCLKEDQFAGKGADCSRLPFALRALVPLP